MAIKWTSSKDIKFYLYRSKAKIESFYQQIREPKKKLKWKFDLKVLTAERQADNEPNLDEKLKAVVSALEDQDMVGLIEEKKPYIKGIFPMRWGIYNDHGFRPVNEGPLIYFGGILGDTLLGLGGSSVHIEGCYGMTSTGSRSNTRALCEWLRVGLETGDRVPYSIHDNEWTEMAEIAEAMALANHYLTGPVQNLEFVAKVLCRGEQHLIKPWDMKCRGEAILATPLFVSQVDPMFEDNVDLPPDH